MHLFNLCINQPEWKHWELKKEEVKTSHKNAFLGGEVGALIKAKCKHPLKLLLHRRDEKLWQTKSDLCGGIMRLQ